MTDVDAIRANLAEVEQRWTDPEEDTYGLLSAAGRLIEDCKALLAAIQTVRRLAAEHVEHADGCGLLAGQILATLDAPR